MHLMALPHSSQPQDAQVKEKIPAGILWWTGVQLQVLCCLICRSYIDAASACRRNHPEHQNACHALQKGLAIVLSLVYGSFNGATSYGVFALMRDIAATNQVANTSSLGMELRCASAVGLTLGSLLFGARIVPVTGKLASLPRVLPHPCYVLAGSLGYPCAFH